MSFKIKCPECGTKMTLNGTGRRGHWHCTCTEYSWCQTIECNVCIDSEKCSGCRWCSCREDAEDNCSISWGDRLCSGKDYCDEWFTPSESASYWDEEDKEEYNGVPCGEAYLCTNFYFHPIWKRVIHCPFCGSFDVDTIDEKNVWKLKCFSCEKQFNLKHKEQKESKNNVKQKQIEQEEAKITLLKKYKELLDIGVLTEEEFEKKKKDVLGIFK